MKIVLSTLAAALLVLVAACAPTLPDTSALKALLVKNNASAAAFAQAIDTASDAATLAAAIDTFTEVSKTFPGEYKAEMDKHPEFATLSESSMPADLKQALADQAAAKAAVSGAVTKLNASPLLNDAAVTAAYQKLAEAAGAK
jgi:hypothetical protein